MDSSRPIALLTDFGTIDPFAGILKGVISRITPAARLIDLSHNIPPGDISRGAIALWQAKPYFPANTVYLCVIDPGVGTARRGLIVESGDTTFIGPDNGVFTYISEPGAQAWELSNPDLALRSPSSTFHGRDIFAPAAAYAARGQSGETFGPPVTDMIRLPLPLLEIVSAREIRGEVLFADRFGNLLTSLGKFISMKASFELVPWLPGSSPVKLSKQCLHLQLPRGESLPIVDTFANIPENSCAGLIGSSGLLEIAAHQASAAEILGLSGGEPITLLSS